LGLYIHAINKRNLPLEVVLRAIFGNGEPLKKGVKGLPFVMVNFETPNDGIILLQGIT